MDRTGWIILGILIVILICLCCLCALFGGSLYFYFYSVAVIQTPTPDEFFNNPTHTPATIHPTSPIRQATAAPTTQEQSEENLTPTLQPTARRENPSINPADTLKLLENIQIPASDLRDLAQRLKGLQNIPITAEPPSSLYQIGDEGTFWAMNEDTKESFQVEATLEYITDHVYFWIQKGVPFQQRDLRELVETFEQDIYPTNRAFFGSEWTPGVDGDVHLYILYARNLGNNLAGSYSPADEYHPLVHKYSNMHEMFFLNADNITLREEFTYGVLAHEFQHMIHWNLDLNEDSWLNEGFSEVAAFLNGYYTSGFDWLYIQDTDMPLNDWPNDTDATPAHYGSSFLFVSYFLDRLGEEVTQALVKDQKNGLSSVDEVLAEYGGIDPTTGAPVTADDLFLDWVIASYVQDADVGDGRFTYKNFQAAPQPGDTETIHDCPSGLNIRDVSQYGVDYINFNCQGDYTLRFEGSQQVSLLPQDAYSGEYAFWSNKGDASDMTLTRSFDFSAISTPVTLKYWSWYDLEEDYDYVYLLASLDGNTWQILTTPSGTDADITGNNYGWGYNGLSGGSAKAAWIQEEVDLSQFAGQKVTLRFEYITDAAVNGEGFLLDDISVPEAGYFENFEQGDGGWEAAGWVRHNNILPQSFRLALITQGKQTSVQYIPLSAGNSVEIPLRIEGDVTEVVLVVTGITRFTRQKADYQFEVLP